MENLDRIPEPGEEVDCGRLHVKVVSVDEQRIERVRISVMPEPAENPDEDKQDD